MTRDFLTVRVWDTYMEKEPIQVIPVHDSLRKQLAECTENDIFFDRFNVGISPYGRSYVTGSYQNTFHVMALLRFQR